MATLHIDASAQNGTKTRICDGRHTFWIDEPPAFGGEDSAPSPVETLLAALAGAINAIGQYVAKEMSLPLQKLDVSIDGDCDSACFMGKSFDARAGFEQIRVHVCVDAADASEELIAKWREQVLLRCPVLDNLCSATEVAVDFSAETIAKEKT